MQDLTELFAQARHLVADTEAKLPILADKAERTSNYFEYDVYRCDTGEEALDLLTAIVKAMDNE